MAAPIIYENADDMRRRFEEGRYFERCFDDDDSVHLFEIEDIGPAPIRFPVQCRSQMVTYADRWDRTIVIAHQHGNPKTGVPCLDTLPDPKFLFEDETRFKYDPSLD